MTTCRPVENSVGTWERMASYPMQAVQTKALAGPCMYKPVLQLVTSQNPNILGSAGG